VPERLFPLARHVDPVRLYVETGVTLDVVVQPAKGTGRACDAKVHGGELGIGGGEGSRGALYLTSESGTRT
jgi:hypothetical protein